MGTTGASERLAEGAEEKRSRRKRETHSAMTNLTYYQSHH